MLGNKENAMQYESSAQYVMVDYEPTMSLDERLRLRMRTIELEDQGKYDEADNVTKQIPLSPHLAMLLKRRMGIDFLAQSGWNLADANEAYGPDWLNK
jgi:hypothetical protein